MPVFQFRTNKEKIGGKTRRGFIVFVAAKSVKVRDCGF